MPSLTEGLYEREPDRVRPSFGSDRQAALRYYAPLVQFVAKVSPPSIAERRTQLIDVGCGSGWSTYALALAGYDASGIDLNERIFEPPHAEHCRLLEGSALRIPFPNESFEAVVSYQVIEHIPFPERVLGEMARVCRPGGVVCIAGPNLVSPLLSVRHLLRLSSWRQMKYRRTPGMPRHPYGNTLWELVWLTPVRTLQLIDKLLAVKPHFTMRAPDTVPPFHADNDACYLCNPIDLIAWFKGEGCQILRRGRHDRPPLAYLLAGGTWVAARKPLGTRPTGKSQPGALLSKPVTER
jgi:SAM-dependent methyltransferase